MSFMAYVPGTTSWRKRRHDEICKETYNHIQEIVDGEITAAKAKQLASHLSECPPCELEAEAIKGLKQAIARVGCEADPQLVQRLDELARKLCTRRDH